MLIEFHPSWDMNMRTESEREHQVCEDYFHHLSPPRPANGRDDVCVCVCVLGVSHFIGQDRDSLFSFGEYEADLVIYTIFPMWAVTNKSLNKKINRNKINSVKSKAPHFVLLKNLKWNLPFGLMATISADLTGCHVFLLQLSHIEC